MKKKACIQQTCARRDGEGRGLTMNSMMGMLRHEITLELSTACHARRHGILVEQLSKTKSILLIGMVDVKIRCGMKAM
jgi:hypothetical protein